MDEFHSEINLKYNKLATEYSKARAQLSVLKKALADEQGVTNDLKKSIKEKDQITRKLEQEVESLNFRNVQLTKRIGILQEDLDKTNFKKTPKTKLSSDSNSILSGELQNRIEENEKLHLQVSTSELMHQQQLNEVTLSLDQAKLELSKQEDSYSEIIKKQETQINKLNEDKAKLELKLKYNEQNLKASLTKEDSIREEYTKVKKDLSNKLSSSNSIIKNNILFLDSKRPEYNEINLPLFYKKQKRQVKKVLLDIKPIILEVLRRFSELHIYIGQKNEFSISDEVLEKLSTNLKKGSPLIKNLTKAIDNFLTYNEDEDEIVWIESLSLEKIVQTFSEYTQFLSFIVPYIQMSINAETKVKLNLPRLVTAHENLHGLTKKLYLCFSRIETWLKFLHQLEQSNVEINLEKKDTLVLKLKTSLTDLTDILKEIKTHMSTKLMVEHQLPTTTTKQKTNDECILASIVGLINGLQVICGHITKLAQLEVCPPYLPNPIVSQYRKRAINYIKTVSSAESKSIPYNQAINNSKYLNEIVEYKQTLTNELMAYKTKVIALEEEKENWMLECQLMQTKMGKEDNEHLIEDEFKQFLRERVSNLVSQIQMADSKATFYHAECVTLEQKLQYFEKIHKEMAEDIETCRKQYSDLQTEQQSVVKSYEEQLHMMSEHMANISEQYAHQKQELDQVRSGGKRGSK